MKREDYEWVTRITASVINAGARGRNVTMDLANIGDEESRWVLDVFIREAGGKSKIVKHLSWYIGRTFGDNPEDIVKEVNRL